MSCVAGERRDHHTLVVALHARVPGGVADLDAEIAHVVTVREGRIVKLDGYEQPHAALSAFGLEH
jgi:ketosteroid isomerase-like protein